jgi:hypothetical protein
VITHVPAAENVTTPEDNEHTVPLPVVIENATVNPDVAVALGV